MDTDKIKAGKHFEIDKWSKLRHTALKLCLDLWSDINDPVLPPIWEPILQGRIDRICKRFSVGAAFSYYKDHPDQF